MALIDTGSPFSIGRGQPIHLLGEVIWPSNARVRILDVAAADLGRNLEWLLGNDVLGHAYVSLDWPGGEIAFSSELPSPGGVSIPMILNGIPIVEIEVAARSQPVFLDTGAKLSYAAPADVAGLAPIRRERDFSPLLGEFYSDVFRCEIRVGGRPILAELGVLPLGIRGRIPAVTAGWVLGSDFFRDRVIVLDYKGGRVLDAPPARTTGT